MELDSKFARELVERVDEDGFISFDYKRMKTGVRVRGILTPDAVQDLKNYLAKIPLPKRSFGHLIRLKDSTTG